LARRAGNITVSLTSRLKAPSLAQGDTVILRRHLAVIGCHFLGIYAVILLQFSAKMTVSPRASAQCTQWLVAQGT
jgi:hypothetical protein